MKTLSKLSRISGFVLQLHLEYLPIRISFQNLLDGDRERRPSLTKLLPHGYDGVVQHRDLSKSGCVVC